MVLMSAASDQPKHAPAPASSPPAPASPSPAPAARTRLHGFSFSGWGTHRLLRCTKDGAPASASAAASPPPHPLTPSPEKEKPQQQSQGQPSPGAAGASQPPRPWNLRTRRSATVAPPASRSEAAGKAAPGLVQQPAHAGAGKRGFSAALTKEEIAEDFAAIRGTRPPRRPKKRPRAVQRQLDMLYPGLSLADVNLDSYKIDER